MSEIAKASGLIDGPQEVMDAAQFADVSGVTHVLRFDEALCTGCGLCEAFCPMEVIAMKDGSPVAVAAEACWGCETCSGQCPVHAIRIEAAPGAGCAAEPEEPAPPLDKETRDRYREWAAVLRDVLGLRWHPVAVSLIRAGEPLPDVPEPTERLRYCQALMAARRGRALMMPANRHACPDGTSILGLTPIPAKLASGELYILFHKLDSVEAARRMVGERPSLPARSVRATVTCPLDDPRCKAEVVAVIGTPEQMMWLSMATSYYTGHRHDFHASGYNAQCVETTLLPLTTGKINISFGCYGCRASSDVDDAMMMMGIPVTLMDDVVRGLRELGKRAIPQSRDKVYLPPF
ncbi:DUF169 domain-containing protein [Xiamenia xianingshaonis]|uniref:4Fe-4S dicluster domain-containing protein n=1 Tax=Xiamenia xianingshaonis TaxID=2682776 RepID=A0A9E6MRF5_9ACTN|nr:DUF169 domain-containing protein [Xiamenia xianingshaonis]NHM13651.1 4Fe-4S dicluster domain-containing protein [Xiamenia xianingshaonis]QTU85023.1 DUF169 domain-containing protein [Xiamenia xianingshaonis]